MIDFNEELKNYQPGTLIEDTEDELYRNDLKDIMDIVMEMTEDLRTSN